MLKIRITTLTLYFTSIYIGFFCGVLLSAVCVNYSLSNNTLGHYITIILSVPGFLASDIVLTFGHVVLILYSGFMILQTMERVCVLLIKGHEWFCSSQVCKMSACVYYDFVFYNSFHSLIVYAKLFQNIVYIYHNCIFYCSILWCTWELTKFTSSISSFTSLSSSPFLFSSTHSTPWTHL